MNSLLLALLSSFKTALTLREHAHGIPQVQHFWILLEYISDLFADNAGINDHLITELQGKNV